MIIQNRETLITEGKRLGVYDPDNRLCVIVGCSTSAKRDYDKFKVDNATIKFDIIVINAALLCMKDPGLRQRLSWCSKHPLILNDLKKKREKYLIFDSFATHCPEGDYSFDEDRWKKKKDSWKKLIDHAWKVYFPYGSSTMFAIGCVIGMGYKGVILCGCELSGKYQQYYSEFVDFMNAYPDYMKAMSGILADLPGVKPTREWIEGVVRNDMGEDE